MEICEEVVHEGGAGCATEQKCRFGVFVDLRFSLGEFSFRAGVLGLAGIGQHLITWTPNSRHLTPAVTSWTTEGIYRVRRCEEVRVCSSPGASDIGNFSPRICRLRFLASNCYSPPDRHRPVTSLSGISVHRQKIPRFRACPNKSSLLSGSR